MVLNIVKDNTSEKVEATLTEFMNDVNSALASFKSEVNTMLSGFTSDVNTNLSTVKSEVTAVKGVVSSLGGAVKSIQRGSLTPSNAEVADVRVNINTVNPDKCVVLLNTSRITGDDTTYLPALTALTATSFTVTFSGGWTSGLKGHIFSWQVIEFY